jgi:IS30 family transposase
MATLPAQSRQTLTWDQGSEMAGRDRIALGFPDGVYFAHPGSGGVGRIESPWQCGSKENMNAH